MRRAITIAIAGTAVMAVAVLLLYALRTEVPPIAISPTPTAAATLSPSPAAPTGRYVNASMLFSMELRAPWRRATCGPSLLGPAEGAEFATDLFVPVPDRDLTFGDTGGPAVDHITVAAQANPQAMTPRQWKESGRAGAARGEKVQDTTLAGRPALLITERDNETFLVANAGYVYALSHQARSLTTSSAERAAIVRSFQFLSAQEARAAASPTPAPRSPEVVADTLADGFAKKDTAILARVAVRCLGEGPDQAGISRKDAQAFLQAIQDRFARGLAVDVQARPLAAGEGPRGYFFVRAVWREPGQPDRDSDLRILVEGGTAYWDTVVYYPRSRP
jgi:hypothetical protein